MNLIIHLSLRIIEPLDGANKAITAFRVRKKLLRLWSAMDPISHLATIASIMPVIDVLPRYYDFEPFSTEHMMGMEKLRDSLTKASSVLQLLSALIGSSTHETSRSSRTPFEAIEDSAKSMGNVLKDVETQLNEAVQCARSLHDRTPRGHAWRDLPFTISNSSAVRCTKPRDQIYAVVGLAKEDNPLRSGRLEAIEACMERLRFCRTHLDTSVATASAAFLSYYWPRINEFNLHPEHLQTQPNQNLQATPALLENVESALGSVPVLIAVLFLYCLAGGLFYFLYIHSRSQELIFSGFLAITTSIGFLSGLSAPEIVFRLLPWTCLSAIVLAALPGRPAVQHSSL
ncbi:hypothetical protein PG993_003468 [Apiospora rasikravindrae]|uniref:Uncharacterized protein n=1 Tax=Apiospora rasikravindrae TaxID=990691 RepID=A0ABR1U2C5_9PEZI